MSITAQAVQRSNQAIDVTWSDTEPPPVAGYTVTATVNAGTPKQRAVLAGDLSTFTDYIDDVGLSVGDTLVYGIVNQDDLETAQTPTLTWRDLDAPFTYGPVNALVDTIRYTSLAEVKARLGIDAADVDQDAIIQQSAIAAEIQIDQMNGRSFPDTGENPEWPGVPEPIRSWATDSAIAVYSRANAPFGRAGSDNWIGTLDVRDEVERALRRNPLALGYQVTFGVGFASSNGH